MAGEGARQLFDRSVLFALYEEAVSSKARDRLWFLCVLLSPLVLLTGGVLVSTGLVVAWWIAAHGKGRVEVWLALWLTGNDIQHVAALLKRANRAQEANQLTGDKDEATMAIHPEAKRLADLAEEATATGEAQTLLLRQALACFSKNDHREHDYNFHQAEIINLLAATLVDSNKEEALALFTRAIRLGEQSVGEADPRVTVWISNLGILLQEQGRYADSMVQFERVLSIKRGFAAAAALPELEAKWSTDMAYLLFSRPAEVVPAARVLELVESALRIRRAQYEEGEGEGEEENGVRVASSLNDCAILTLLLASSVVDQQEEEKGDAWLLEAMELAQQRGRESAKLYAKVLGDDHPTTQKAKQDWGGGV